MLDEWRESREHVWAEMNLRDLLMSLEFYTKGRDININ